MRELTCSNPHCKYYKREAKQLCITCWLKRKGKWRKKGPRRKEAGET